MVGILAMVVPEVCVLKSLDIENMVRLDELIFACV